MPLSKSLSMAILSLSLTLACGEDTPASPDLALKDLGSPDAPALDQTAMDLSPPDLGPPDAAACPAYKAELPPYVFTSNDVATKDQAYLDRMATEYACAKIQAGQTLDDADFFYSWAPVTLFNRVIAGKTTDIKKMRWVMHVSGYFGALWLNVGLGKTTSSPPSDAGFTPLPDGGSSSGGSLGDMVGESRKAAKAAAGTSDEVYAFNKKSLLAFIYPSLGIASNFGYNKGYLLEIYEKPPKGLSAPKGFVTCKGPLWCDYLTSQVPALAALKTVSASLSAKTGRYKDLAGVQTSQGIAELLGRGVWGTFMKKDKVKQGFYSGLLDVSASFLEVVQAAGLYSAKGYGDKDAAAGRTGALLQSGLTIWLGAYMGGFSHSMPKSVQLPRLVKK